MMTQTKQTKPPYTSGQVAKILGLSTSRIRKARETLDIGVLCGAYYLYYEEDIAAIKDRQGKRGDRLNP